MLTYMRQGNQLVIRLGGEIDHHTARDIKQQMDDMICSYPLDRLILDMTDVRFMDSAGIGILLGRYRLVRSRGGTVSIRNASGQVDRVIEMAGLYHIIKKET